jgi:hypothetical protein
MEGLLNFIKSPAGQGLLAAVAGGMAGAQRGTPWNNVGRGLVTGIQGYSGALDQESRAAQAAQAQEMQALQRQQMEMNMAAAQRQQQEAEAARAAQQQFIEQVNPQANALANPFAGEAGPSIPQVDPFQQQMYQAMQAGILPPQDWLKSQAPKQPEAFTLSPGQVRFQGDQKIAELQERQDPNKPFLGIDPATGQPIPNPAYQRYELERAARGAARHNVNVNVPSGRQDAVWGDAPSGMVWARNPEGQLMLEQDPRTGAATPRAVKIGGTSTQAQSEVDKKFSQEYADFVAGGGVADVEKQLTQLSGVLGQLETDKSLTGPFRGMLPDTVRSVTNPPAVAAKNAVEEVVQRSLRAVLGAQFTEKEGERLIARAYNPQLSVAENEVRVRRLAEQIQRMAQSKIDAARHYEQYGTLQGWQGRLPSLADINLDPPGARPKQASGPSEKPKVGTVVDGYRYKGGDPANKANWVKQ